PEAGETVARDLGRDLSPLDGLVQSRQRLGTKERRREELVRAWDLGLLARQVEDSGCVDDEPSHRVPQSGYTSGTALRLRLIWLVAAMEEDGVAVRIAKPGPVADARVPHLVDLHAGRLQLRLRLGHVGDADGDRSWRQRRELGVGGVRRHYRKRHVAGFVLDPV